MDERAQTKLRQALGTRCRELRAMNALSQLDIVRYFDFSLSHYQKIERGDLDPRLSTVARLSEVFGLSLSEFLQGIEPPRERPPPRAKKPRAGGRQ